LIRRQTVGEWPAISAGERISLTANADRTIIGETKLRRKSSVATGLCCLRTSNFREASPRTVRLTRRQRYFTSSVSVAKARYQPANEFKLGNVRSFRTTTPYSRSPAGPAMHSRSKPPTPELDDAASVLHKKHKSEAPTSAKPRAFAKTMRVPTTPSTKRANDWTSNSHDPLLA